MPVLTVTSSDWRAAQARDAGADVTLPIADLHRLPDLVAQYARTMDAETVARLRQQCRAALPPQGVEGIRRFNSGAFYAQHDIFEALWMAEPGPVRELYRVILQVGVAYYHIVRGNYLGGLKMLQRSAQWFAVLPDTCQGVDVRQLRQDAAAVRDVLRAAGPSGPRHFDRSLLKPVRLVSDGAGSTDC